MKRCVLSISSALIALTAPALALAGVGEELESLPEKSDPAIYNGSEVGLCGWPTTVHVSNGGSWCTGTLIHPRVVVYAAHCGASNTTIRFGESVNQGKIVGTVDCQTNPGWGNQTPTDYAYCVLDEDVPLPITPPVFGCEQGEVFNGQQAAIVGFGNNSGSNGSGTKRWGMTTLSQLSWNQNTVNVGASPGDATVCSGDSGGPIFVEYDGAWHALGIASVKYSSTCDDAQGMHALIEGAIPWIEEQTGIDVTPCHDPNGNWIPGPDCGGFLTSGVNGSGNYSSWCQGTGESGYSTACGPGFDTAAESNPPTVSIASPTDQQFFPDAPTTTPININATDDSGYVAFVQLEIDGMLLPDQDTVEPWVFNTVQFPQGSWELRAYAEDYFGNSAWSAPVTIHVGEMGGTTTGTTGTSETTDPSTSEGEEGEVGTSSGSDGTTSDPLTTTGPTSADTGFFDEGGSGDPEGCACSADHSGSGALAFFGLGLLGLVRRRREI
jgi:uncharacterized protein (TIGR03382 family)